MRKVKISSGIIWGTNTTTTLHRGIKVHIFYDGSKMPSFITAKMLVLLSVWLSLESDIQLKMNINAHIPYNLTIIQITHTSFPIWRNSPEPHMGYVESNFHQNFGGKVLKGRSWPEELEQNLVFFSTSLTEGFKKAMSYSHSYAESPIFVWTKFFWWNAHFLPELAYGAMSPFNWWK